MCPFLLKYENSDKDMKYFIGVKYKLELRGQIDATFRVKLNEAYPLKQVCTSDQK